MNTGAVEEAFRKAVCADVRIAPEGIGRYRIFTPFRFDDGDLVSLVLKQEGERWALSDEANTYMRLSYRLDDKALGTEGRARIIQNALDASGIEDRGGELVAVVDDNRYGEALFSLVQAVLRMADVSVLTREVVRSTFIDDLRQIIEEIVPATQRVRNWHEPKLDPDGHYPVDWYVRGEGSPLFIFALTSDDRVKDATITLHQFERWQYEHRTLGIFQDQPAIHQKALARFTDVAEKNFSALHGNEDRVSEYLKRIVSPSPN